MTAKTTKKNAKHPENVHQQNTAKGAAAMNKKSFTKNNPAIQFISEMTKPEPEPTPKEEKQGAAAPQAQEPAPQKFQYMKPDKETKTRRVQIVLKPSIAAKLKERAKAEGTSVNDFISQLLERTL